MLSSLFCGSKNAMVIFVQEKYIILRYEHHVPYTYDNNENSGKEFG